jgi:biotin transport system substrate-specific component
MVISNMSMSRRLFILSGLFTALTVLGAQIRIPLPFVPITLQTFFVLLSGHLLGPMYGAASQMAYLFLGLSGLPVFSEGGGIGYMLNPKFGYLCGFPLASFAAGIIVHHDAWRHPNSLPEVGVARLILANLLALAAIFLPGVFYLWLSTNFILGKPLAFSMALWSGCLIFLPGDVIKITGIVLLYRAIQPRLAGSLRT